MMAKSGDSLEDVLLVLIKGDRIQPKNGNDSISTSVHQHSSI